MNRHVLSLGLGSVAAVATAGILFRMSPEPPAASPTPRADALAARRPMAVPADAPTGQAASPSRRPAASEERSAATITPTLVEDADRPGLKAMLDAARKAIRYSAIAGRKEPVRLAGTAERNGARSPFSMLFQPGGRFVQRFDGEAELAAGYDGKNAWTMVAREPSEGMAREELAIPSLVTWVATGGWLAADGPVKVEQGPLAGTPVLQLKGTNPAAGTATLELDPVSHLPSALTRTTASGTTERWVFEQYADCLDFRMAHRMVRQRDGRETAYRLFDAAPVAGGGDPFQSPAAAKFAAVGGALPKPPARVG